MASYEELIAQQLEEERQRKEAAALERDRQLQLMLDKYEAPVDVSPLGGTLDFIYGGNMAQSLKPQPDQQADLINQLLAEERAEPKGSTGLLRSALASKDKQAGAQDRYETSKQDQFESEIQKDLEKDILEPINKRKSEFEIIDEALRTGDVNSVAMILDKFSRSIGDLKGVVTDKDASRIMPNTAINSVAKLQAYITGEGKADPTIIGKLKNLVDGARREHSKVTKEFLENKKTVYGKRSLAKKFNTFKAGGFGQEVFDTAKQSLETFEKPKAEEISPPQPITPPKNPFR